MTVILTMLRYPKRHTPFALLSMMIFRLPLSLNRKLSFWKLMGSGKNGTFDKKPDWQQWGLLTVMREDRETEITIREKKESIYLMKMLYGIFICRWIHFFKCETWTIVLEPIEGHGTWNGKKVFGTFKPAQQHKGMIAVLTRATIRISKLKSFWNHVNGVAEKMAGAKGFVTSLGIGEVPWTRQATFSVWESTEDMKQFAYQLKEHREVILKTHSEKWYSEDMFTRFRIIGSMGTLRGIDPLKGKL